MKKIIAAITFVIAISAITILGQTKSYKLNLNISVSDSLANSYKTDGRLIIYFTTDQHVEPRYLEGTLYESFVFATNISNWNRNIIIQTDSIKNWMKTCSWDLSRIPSGTYYIQALWKQNRSESSSNSAGNLCSRKIRVDLDKSQEKSITISEIIRDRKLVKTELLKLFEFNSKILSDWWKRPMKIKASVLLPSGYFKNPDKKYPVAYNIAGYGGRYTRVDYLVKYKNFYTWWSSDKAPQIVVVFLDGDGPYGDCYQMNSDNNGPYGDMLIKELIPEVEKKYRIIGTQKMRFVYGCSTGGWVSLALQLLYPNEFNGSWSYSPDPVDFHQLQLVNIYDSKNAFYYNSEYTIPSMRNVDGQPLFSVKHEVMCENVQGFSNTYVTSGEQWGAWNAVFSPKGKDGLPEAIFDPFTGAINKKVAEYWKRYDLLKYVKENWPTLGPEIQGKVYIWAGDMDNFYLNNAMRNFDDYIRTTINPKSDAVIEFAPLQGHCSGYSDKEVLEKIEKRMEAITKGK